MKKSLTFSQALNGILCEIDWGGGRQGALPNDRLSKYHHPLLDVLTQLILKKRTKEKGRKNTLAKQRILLICKICAPL